MVTMKSILKKVIIFSIVAFFIPISVKAYDYTIDNYYIEIKINEDNSYDIVESISTNFEELRHGIIRKIPIINYVERVDGSKNTVAAEISDINTNIFSTYRKENGFYNIKIGESSKTIIGDQTFNIRYKYQIKNDPLDDMDEVYFNLIGNDWDTTISNVNFRIDMPKNFDKDRVYFYSGDYGQTNGSNIEYDINDNTIIGHTTEKLLAHQALTIKINLDEGYFKMPKKNNTTIISVCIIVLGGIFVFINFYLWYKHGKDAKIVQTVELFAPDNLNSLELAYMNKGSARAKDVTSLVVYLANKGYLEVEEYKIFNGEENVDKFRLIKLKEYNESNKYEKEFFNVLFKKGKTEINSDEYQKDIELASKIYGLKNEIDADKRKIIMEETYNNSAINYLFLILGLIIVILPVVHPLKEFGNLEIVNFLIGLIPILFLFGASLIITDDGSVNIKNTMIAIPFALCALGVYSYVFKPFLFDKVYINNYWISIISLIVGVIFNRLMPKRTKYGTEILGRIRGFKDYLQIVEKEQLEALVMKYPTYFYDILPYAYVLDISDLWIEKFEQIKLKTPSWYVNSSDFDFVHFSDSIDCIVDDITNSSLDFSNSSSSDSSSGGGFSGGGSGGGGGTSW